MRLQCSQVISYGIKGIESLKRHAFTLMAAELLLTLYKECYAGFWGCKAVEMPSLLVQTGREADGILMLDLPPWYKTFYPKNVPLSFFGLSQSRVNLPGLKPSGETNSRK